MGESTRVQAGSLRRKHAKKHRYHMSLVKSNCDLTSRAAYAQGTLQGNGWTRAGTRQRTAAALSMQFDIDAPKPHAGVAHR